MGARINALSLGCALVVGCGQRRDVVPTLVPSDAGGGEPTWQGRFTIVRHALTDDGPRGIALGDCNGDGRLDVVTVSQQTGSELHLGAADSRFERVPGALANAYAEAAVFVDLDDDGIDELVLAGSSVVALPGQGGCHYGAPVTLAGDGDSVARQVLVTDVNLDGRADLSITQRGSLTTPHRLLVARGDGTFDELRPTPTPLSPDRFQPEYLGFAMFYRDLDEDGAMDLFAMIDQRQGWFSWGMTPGEVAQSRDDAVSTFLANADAMSISPIDYDRDGAIEWFVSGVSDRSRLLHFAAPRQITDRASGAGVEGEGADFAWGSYSFDADLDGWPDLLVLHEGADMGPSAPPAARPVSFFLNRHNGTFAELGRETLGLSMNAKGLSCGPLSAQGPVGCFAMNLDGPVLLIDALLPRGRQAVLHFRGTVSAADATGARVSVEGVSPPMVFEVGGQCPSQAEHARTLQIPLGEREAATVTVRWPSGIEQRGVSILADRVNEVTEPRAVTLSRRVLAADGQGTIDVMVDPRMLGGGTADLALTGSGEWVGAPTIDAQGVVRRTLRAPSMPGEARVTVTLDGRPLRVRPRVVFVPQA